MFVSGNAPYNYPLGLKGGFVHSGENKFLRNFKELIIILFHQFRTAEKWLKSLAKLNVKRNREIRLYRYFVIERSQQGSHEVPATG